jgi:hypothetical protein
MKGFPSGIRGEATTNQTGPHRTTGAAGAASRRRRSCQESGPAVTASRDNRSDDVVAEDVDPAIGRLLLRIIEACSYHVETSWKNRLAASCPNGM